MIRYIAFFLLIWLAGIPFLNAQDSSAVYWFRFKDKEGTPYTLSNPEAFLSSKAIERRKKQNIPIEKRDLPVNPAYVKQVAKAGKKVLIRSKWLNGAAVLLKDSGQLREVRKFDFVDTGFRVRGTYLKPNSQQVNIPDLDMLYGRSDHQVEMMNGHLLHQMDLKGKGIDIAVLDAGFTKAHELKAFEHLQVFNLLKGTYDFVKQNKGVFSYSFHGSMVLSVMGGYLEHNLTGTAPLSNYWLLRSENTNSEFLIEEYSWVAAAEYADSVGVEIINSSLGYTTFDDTLSNHKISILNGKTAPVSRAASIAAQKGILVVTSAGNKGNDPSWQKISAPADADSVLTVGAVDSNRRLSNFSSRGPTADGRIKPEIVAQGEKVFTAGDEDNQLFQGYGTSFSAPLVAGMAATLWQAYPEVTNMEIRDAIIKSASHYKEPDTFTGYGIPDFYEAYLTLKKSERSESTDNHLISITPNPFKDRFGFAFYAKKNNTYRVNLINAKGQIIKEEKVDFGKGVNQFQFQALSNLTSGIYMLVLSNDEFRIERKLIKR